MTLTIQDLSDGIWKGTDMKPGTVIRLPDNQEATLVYNFLDGRGVAYGRHTLGADESTWPEVEAMLREPYPGAILTCVGEEFEVIE